MKNLNKFYIYGLWVNPISDKSLPVINPSNEEVIGCVFLGNDPDVNKHVLAINDAF